MVLVIGATGTIGKHLVGELRKAGTPFRALVRDEAKGRALGADYVVGDLDSPASLGRAFEGADRVFLNTGASEALVRQQTAAIQAAKNAGAKYVVRVSVPGAGPSSPVPLGRWHGEVEEALKKSGVPGSNLHPGFFMQNLMGLNAGSIRSEGKIYGAYKQGRIALIDALDIAASAAALLANPRPTDFFLTGPEAITFDEIAAKFSKALGKPVQYVDRPAEQVVAGMKSAGVPAAIADEIGKLMVAFASGAASAVSPAVAELTGRPARNLDAFLADNAGAFR